MTKEELLKTAKPILFNTDMVRAILEGKSVTRRVVKGYIPKDAVFGYSGFTPSGHVSCRGTFEDGYGEEFFKLCYRKGDILYVRETFQKFPNYKIGEYPTQKNPNKKPDSWHYVYKADCFNLNEKWCPSIHMPKEAARIFLKVTDVRVEKLHDITDEQIIREGISRDTVEHYMSQFPEAIEQYVHAAHFLPYSELWDSIIRKSELSLYGWEANPWVWVIEFERIL